MKIEVNKKDENNAGVKISGRFDAFAAPDVSIALKKLMENGTYNIRVDLSETNFIDSTALAQLVKMMKRARQGNGDLTLCYPSEPVTVILELTALDKAFKIEAESRSRAMAETAAMSADSKPNYFYEES